MKVRNRTGQTLHVVLAYFADAYGIYTLANEAIEAGDGWMTVWGDGPRDNFYLNDGADESLERFKLIVSTENIDDFLIAQPVLTLGAEYGDTKGIESIQPPRKSVYKNEWFTTDFHIHLVRRLDALGTSDRSLAGGRIVVKGHPEATANISLTSARTASRSVGSAGGFYQAFEQRGMALLNFATTRGDDLSVLELTDIQNAASLEGRPLEIELNVPLADREGILPVVYDGQHVLLGGAAHKEHDGTTRIVIDSIPDVADQRRSLGGSLKLYFFKTVSSAATSTSCGGSTSKPTDRSRIGPTTWRARWRPRDGCCCSCTASSAIPVGWRPASKPVRSTRSSTSCWRTTTKTSLPRSATRPGCSRRSCRPPA